MPAIRFGRRPAVDDRRVPFMAQLAGARTLPAPPSWVNWYAAIGEWGMLGNDVVGDCVEAMAGHATLQFTTYSGSPREPTAAEAIALYSEITGYIPGNPGTDNGTVVLGAGGLMERWAKAGIVYGGVRSEAKAYCRVRLSLADLQQAIHYFGGVGLGINVPESIVAGDTVPFMWADPSGPMAGGHEVWVNGYEEIAGDLVFDLVSWGVRCRMTSAFLLGTAEEAVAIYDPDSLDARGMNAEDFDPAELLAAMAVIKAG